MSFDEVLNKMMKLMPEEDFYEHVLNEHRQRLKKIKAGEFAESNDLDNALEEVWGAFLTDDDAPQQYQVVYGKGFLKDLKRIIKGGNKSIKSNVQNAIQELKSGPHKKRPGLDIKLISKREDNT